METRKYIASDIMKNYKKKVFIMANEPLSREVVEELKSTGLSPLYIARKNEQYIAISQVAKNNLIQVLERSRRQAIEAVEELEKMIQIAKEKEDMTWNLKA